VIGAFTRSDFGNSGNADVANAAGLHGAAQPLNCFYANQASQGELAASPAGIEQTAESAPRCVTPSSAARTALLSDLSCGTLFPTLPYASLTRSTKSATGQYATGGP
jgi:hypothetical protein